MAYKSESVNVQQSNAREIYKDFDLVQRNLLDIEFNPEIKGADRIIAIGMILDGGNTTYGSEADRRRISEVIERSSGGAKSLTDIL